MATVRPALLLPRRPAASGSIDDSAERPANPDASLARTEPPQPADEALPTRRARRGGGGRRVPPGERAGRLASGEWLAAWCGGGGDVAWLRRLCRPVDVVEFIGQS